MGCKKRAAVKYLWRVQTEEPTLGQAIRHILTRDFILAFFVLFAFILAHYMLTPTLPIYLKGLGAREAEIGVLVGAFGLSSLFLRLIVGQALLTYSERSIMMAGALVFAVSFFGCMVLPLFWPLFVVRLFQGLAFALLDTAVLAFVVRILPPAYAGQGLGYCLLAVNFSLALSPILGMSLINRFNFTVLFLVGVFLSSCAFLFSFLVKGAPPVRPKAPLRIGGFMVNTKVIPHALSTFFQNSIW
jgi:MFS family permease